MVFLIVLLGTTIFVAVGIKVVQSCKETIEGNPIHPQTCTGFVAHPRNTHVKKVHRQVINGIST